MIVSHSRKFIFVHCRKVAGSSMKVAIAPYLSGDDIVIGSLNEIIAAGGAPTQAMKKLLLRPQSRGVSIAATMLGKTWPEAQNIALKMNFRRALGPDSPHPTALRAANFFGDAWHNYTKFCFVRNPWTRVVSDYYWHMRSTGRDFSFEAYLEALSRGNSRIVHSDIVFNWDMMAVGGKVVVDHVGRFENIDEDFKEITVKIGLPALALKTAEKAAKAKPDHAALYSAKCRKLVENLFAPELEAFDYKWPF